MKIKTMNMTVLLASIVWMATVTYADTYIVHSDSPDAAAAWENYLINNFTPESVGRIYKGGFANAAPVADENDVVIFLRETSSRDYAQNTIEVETWANLKSSILMMNPQVVRVNQLGWTSGGEALKYNAAGDESKIDGKTDPIWAGVNISGGTADLFVDVDEVLTISKNSFPGKVLAHNGEANFTLGRIAAGSAWSLPEGVRGTHGGNRVVFCTPANSTNSVFSGLTDDGLKVVENTLTEFGLTAVHKSVTLTLFTFLGATILLVPVRRT